MHQKHKSAVKFYCPQINIIHTNKQETVYNLVVMFIFKSLHNLLRISKHNKILLTSYQHRYGVQPIYLRIQEYYSSSDWNWASVATMVVLLVCRDGISGS